MEVDALQQNLALSTVAHHPQWDFLLSVHASELSKTSTFYVAQAMDIKGFSCNWGEAARTAQNGFQEFPIDCKGFQLKLLVNVRPCLGHLHGKIMEIICLNAPENYSNPFWV